MTSCDAIREALHDGHDAETPPPAFAAHLRACADCRAEHEALRRLAAELSSLLQEDAAAAPAPPEVEALLATVETGGRAAGVDDAAGLLPGRAQGGHSSAAASARARPEVPLGSNGRAGVPAPGVPLSCDDEASSHEASSEPGPRDPASSDPASRDPASRDPASSEPASGEPASGEPVSGGPVSGGPASGEPASGEPASNVRVSSGEVPRAPALRAVPAARGRPAWRRRMPVGALAAAALLVAAVLVLQPRAGAGPLELVRRSAAGLLAVHDVELWLTIELPALDALASLFGAETPPGPHHQRLFVCAPDLFLAQEVEAFGGGPATAPLSGRLSGHDGEVLWSFDPDEGQVELAPGGGRVLGELSGREETAADLPGLLVWNVLRDLAGLEESARITDVTGPADARAGLRRFVIEPAGEEEKEKAGGEEGGGGGPDLVWARTELLVSQDRGLVERAVVDVRLAFASLLRLTVETAAVDSGLPPSFFERARHVPAGTPEVWVEEEREGEAGDGEEEGR